MSTFQAQRVTPPGGVSIGTTETTITWGQDLQPSINLDAKKSQTLTFRLGVATTTLNSLKVYGKVHADDSVWVPLLAAAADYTGNANPHLLLSEVRVAATGAYVNANAYVTPAADYALLVLRNSCFAALKLTATVAAGTGTITGYMTAWDSPILPALTPSEVALLAKLPSVGTAGTASANVLSVQGVGGGTVLPVSGTVTATGAALETGGQLELLRDAEDYVVSAAYTATLGATAVIPTAFTAVLPAGLVRIVLIPRGDIYYAIGAAASASTQKIPGNTAFSLPFTKTVADTIQVYAGSVVCDLLVCTPRS